MKLKFCKFMNSELHDIDFTYADLNNIQFSHCDLSRSTFDQTLLEKPILLQLFTLALILRKTKLKNKIR